MHLGRLGTFVKDKRVYSSDAQRAMKQTSLIHLAQVGLGIPRDLTPTTRLAEN
jgi:hypothetical protein